MKLNTAETVALVLGPLFLLALILTLNFSTDVQLPRLVSLAVTGSDASVPTTGPGSITQLQGPEPEFRILVGVITFAYHYENRHLIRLIRSVEPKPSGVQVDVRFVICTLGHEEDRVLVALEALQYGDIMILDCRENGNSGKTYTFFSTVARLFNRSDGGKPYYDYVMKTDDDTYVRYAELVEALRPLPREDIYFGHMVPEGHRNKEDPMFMKGMGYVLSWDIVEWIAGSEWVRNNTAGGEDKVTGGWLRYGGKGKNIYDTKPSAEQVEEWRKGGGRILDDKATQYDLPWPPLRFMPRTISVHRLKDHAKWAQALKYFNVTADLQPSTLFNFTVT